MIKGLNKIIDDGLRAKHERREGILQIYRDLKKYYYGKKAQKLITKKQRELVDNMGHSITKNKEISYIETLMNGSNITGDLLYDWDAKDGNPMNSGGGKFSRIVQSPLYKENISDCEMELFKKHADEISGLILNAQPKRIIDMGGGDGQKTIDILSLLDKASIANINITTKDISPYLGQAFVHNIKTWSQTSQTPIEASFMFENFLAKKELQSNKDKRMYLFSGGSIGQFEDDDIITIIQNMISESVLGKRYALMTAFIAPDNTSSTYDDDVQQLLATYGSPDQHNPYYNHETHSTIEDWVMSGIYHHLGKQVENKLSFHVHYENQGDVGGRVILGAKVREPFTITVGQQTYSKQVGDFLPAIQSRRFSKSHILGLIKKAGCDIEAFDQEGGVGQLLFHTPSINLDNMTPEKIQSWRRTAKLFGAGALLVGGMILGNQWSDYKKQKQQEERRRQEVNWELGNTKNTGLGPTASGIESGRESYSAYLKDIYGVEKPDELKYDFLSRYVQAYKRGEIRYGGRMGGYTEPIILIDKYITENKLRIKFDKGVEFISHKELIDKEDIMRATLQANDNIVYSNSTTRFVPDNHESTISYADYTLGSAYKTLQYKTYRMKEGFYLQMEYILNDINGQTYLLARHKNNSNNPEPFSIKNGKKLIRDYFTPIGATDISDKFAGLLDYSSQSPESSSIQDKIIELVIQGYEFDYSLFKHDNYNIKSYYFLQTFFPELTIKDTLHMDYNLKDDINLVTQELLHFYPKLGTNNHLRAKVESKIFNNMIMNTLLPGFYERKGNKKVINIYELKQWIINFIDDLGLDTIDNFPFHRENLDNEYPIGHNGWISKEGNYLATDYGSMGGRQNQLTNRYITKNGEEFIWGRFYYNKKKYLVAKYIGNNQAYMNNIINNVINEYVVGNQYGWTEEDKKFLKNGTNNKDYGKYKSMMQKVEQDKNEIEAILYGPNTYLGQLLYKDWLER